MTQRPKPDPRPGPLPRKAPGAADEPRERRAPGAPDDPDRIDAPAEEDAPGAEPDTPQGTIAVDPGEAHVGATEERVGDRTGPGAGYDQKRRT